MDLLIFLETLSPRVEYVFKHIFVKQLGLEIEFTTQINDFISSDKPKLSYTKLAITNSIFFYSHSLLYESAILEQDINLSIYRKVTPIVNIRFGY